ncbi:Clan CA, family C19, ubiquitin hydrolase-like cysteine peptidase [Tritrichomonas foetus]|uniref:Ubiquitin carboxyl-terminal hydrolase n=1 Tax=Tritrichomonas foetus TaxID=1144522 RepID=A0A1J4L1K6_9EUKA|nr:Clan CA, family C19, ubiquitin hydrolase-like cysteine peptidase [Tritrichomonas foetus]|eukprot:OHT17401.1 Clan CA, family C19, ubiquitin hydrolase-like cysteine peptidase [Tritrichomonas foetus]
MKVNVTHGSDKHEVELDPEQPVRAFMETLQKLTKVPLERQKLMMRRKLIHLDDDWKSFEVKPQTRFMLIGTAEVPPEPVEPSDNTDNDLSNADIDDEVPSYIAKGLKNYGNTCYLNAVLQVFRLLPEIPEILKDLTPPETDNGNVVKQLALLFENFPNNLNNLIKSIYKANPDFCQKDVNGNNMQQDAAECWSFLINCINQCGDSRIPDLFNIEFESTTHLVGSEEVTSVKKEKDNRLRCDIDQDTRQIEQGIEMSDEFYSTDPETKEEVKFCVQKLITTLPKYLTIQMMRFYYRTEEATTAKVLRRVEHPFRLDTLQWLAPNLREKVVKNREDQKEEDAGYYRLKAIITHRGRSADMGHYISFVCVDEQWYRFNDEKVEAVDDEAIQALNGSGDWDCSYILIYEAV